jgi:hypothetical protein
MKASIKYNYIGAWVYFLVTLGIELLYKSELPFPIIASAVPWLAMASYQYGIEKGKLLKETSI